MSKTNHKSKKKRKNNKKKYYKKVVSQNKVRIDSNKVLIDETPTNKEIQNISTLKEIKKYNLTLVYFIILFYYEFLYQIFTFGIANLFSLKTIYYLVFNIIISIILNYITKLFSKKTARRVSLFIILLIGIYYFASYLFKSVFNTYFSIHLLGVSDQAIAFMGTLIELVIKALPVLILYVLPFILTFKFKKHISFKRNKKIFFINLISLVLSLLLFITLVNVNSEVKTLFYEIDNNAMNMEKLGVNVSTYLDIKRIFVKVEEKIDISESIDNVVDEEQEKTYGYNTLDIDFDSLIASESNSTIKDMHEYISKNGATLKNEYTGIYKDKNLIVIMGESLNEIAISEKYTPTLYKLAHEGFEFTNFYTPVNLSTLGGEFQNLTGLFANLSMLSNYFRKGNNYFPYGLGNIYGNLGYTLNAYHPNYGTFQDRNKYLKSMGFNNFLYRGNGLEKKMNCNKWPQSDFDMVDVTIDDFINEDKFMTYYVSVSGHMPWGWSSNDMSKKNKNLLNGSGYSEEAAAYIAANIELDKAVEKIIQKLEETNKLDDTVIAVVPDHYPYSMNINTINELSNYTRDERFEVNHSTLILWNNKQEHKVIDKVCTQLDFIPTLYNLYGIEYDSRLFMGKDILSTSEGLAYFTDRSWISDKGRYVSASNKFTPNEGVEVDENYVKNMNKIVSARINMSKLIIEHDYYKKVLK